MIRDMSRIFVVCCTFCFSIYGFGQTNKYEPHIRAVETVIDGYNQQNYHLMQKPWGLLGKVLISSSMLRKEFQPFYTKYGTAEIDTIVFSSLYNGTAQLTFAPFPEKRTFLTFNFSKKGKIEGMGFGYPLYIYKREQILPNKWLSAEEKRIKIDSIVSNYTKSKAPDDFSGCILVTDGAEVLYKTCLGYADVDNQSVNNEQTMFLLASCSKQFTAVAIMQLLEQGKLKLDDDVQSILPQFPYVGITIEHLLTHTSGLPDYFPLLSNHWDKTKYATNADVLKLLNEYKPRLLFNVNEHFNYSNTGYVILSLVIEKISGMSYGDYLAKHVFEPLKMNRTSVYHRRAQGDTLANYAKGYLYSKKHKRYMFPDSLERYQYTTYMDKITGDDGVSSCLPDLKIWNEALQQRLLINETSTQLIYSKHILNDGSESSYGYGFMLRKGDGIEDVYYHTGGWPGYSTMILRFAERDESIIVLSNNAYKHFDFLVDEICTVLLK